ncbi:MAG: hypothetical protein QOJ04_1801 [Caballeronia sp.]|nr:hypothetical protein [Caballeronia sp.]
MPNAHWRPYCRQNGAPANTGNHKDAILAKSITVILTFLTLEGVQRPSWRRSRIPSIVTEKVENDQADACPRRCCRRAVHVGKSGCLRAGQRQAGYGRKLEHRVELFAAYPGALEETPQTARKERRERASLRSRRIKTRQGNGRLRIRRNKKNPHRRRSGFFYTGSLVRFNAQPVRTSATSSEAYTPHRMSPSA